jgi:hypothetical protein
LLWVSVRPLPPADCEQIVNELAGVAAMGVARWSVLSHDRGIAVDLAPGKDAEILEGIRLKLAWHKETFDGILTLDTSRGLLSKLAGTDVHEFRVRFARDDARGAREQFQEIIEQVKRRCGPLKHLPIPSQVSRTEELPLPGRATDTDAAATHGCKPGALDRGCE